MSRIRYEQPLPAVARIVLARPDKRNAQDRELLYELDDAYARALRDEQVRVIVLAADGPDFSSGHDLDSDWSMNEETPRMMTGGFGAAGAEGWFATEEELFTGLCLRWRDIPRPTIAQVQGRVIGGGLMLVWPCDLVVAGSDASFVDPVGAFGVNGGEYFTHLWELGARRAKEMLFTGEAIGAQEAMALGMVNQVVPPEQLNSATLELAERIARRPTFGLRLAKRSINHGLDLQGQRASIEAAFGLHHLAHAHNRELHGQLVDPDGQAVIRDLARQQDVRRRDVRHKEVPTERTSMMARTVEELARGGTYFEAPRWHDGRWWVSDIYELTVRAYDTAGRGEDIVRVEQQPSGLGWLPDGSMLIVSMKDRRLLRRGRDGTVTVHADLSSVCETDLNDLVVDAQGRAFVGTIGFAIAEGELPRSASVFRIDPDGGVTVAATGLWCPNGMVIGTDERTLIVDESFASRLTAFTIGDDGSLTDRRVFAQIGEAPEPGPTQDMFAAAALIPDGSAMDAEDHVWVADPLRQRCVRISPAGEIVDEIVSPDGQDIFACALGGEDGRTLLLCAAPDFFAAAQGGNQGQGVLLTTRVDVPRGGRP